MGRYGERSTVGPQCRGPACPSRQEHCAKIITLMAEYCLCQRVKPVGANGRRGGASPRRLAVCDG